MSLETQVLTSALKLTRTGSTEVETISLDAGISAEVVRRIMRKSAERGIVSLERKTVKMSREQRLSAVIEAVEKGADPERACNLLGWDEFEDFSALAFEGSGFKFRKHFVFKYHEGRREIDILAMKNPLVISVDCKHWHRSWRRSSIIKIVEKQIERTRTLAEASMLLSEKMGLSGWREATFVPMIFSLFPSDFKFHDETPIVPILQLRNFVDELPSHIDEIRHFSAKLAQPLL